MADTSRLAGLLDRAGHVFLLARQLADSFYQSLKPDASLFDALEWEAFAPKFEEIWAKLIEIKDDAQNPPDGFADVAFELRETARIARQIWSNVIQADNLEFERLKENLDSNSESATPASRSFPLDYERIEICGGLSATAAQGLLTISKAWKAIDPFLFNVRPAASKELDIDPKPAVPTAAADATESPLREEADSAVNGRPSTKRSTGRGEGEM